MLGLMMDLPLSITSLIEHADRQHGDAEIVSRRADGSIERIVWRDLHRRARRLANALASLGIRPGDRVGTLAWNGQRHLETYYAVSCMGAVCHTINPRLFQDQIAWIVDDADDVVVLFDACFAPLVAALRPQLPRVKHWIVYDAELHSADVASARPEGSYESLIGAASEAYAWPDLDERAASSLCYTSGTTGHPKGALYSHRSTVLHAYAASLPDAMNLSARDCAMPVVPMFHVNAWGMPYSTALAGCKLVLPGPKLDGESLHRLIEGERVTVTAGVPTVWLGVLGYMREHGLRFTSLERVVIGGSACPPAMIDAFNEHGVEVLHAWGMTELSPLGTVARLKYRHATATEAERRAAIESQGRSLYGIDMRIVGGDGRELPWDGKAFGDLQVRGPWVIREYVKGRGAEQFAVDERGRCWFATGDVATIDADGNMRITDRSKDVIKSGGEWISSIELENLAIAHPAVLEAAVIGMPHPKWDERPLLVVVLKPGAVATRDELLAHFEGKVAKWWIPDDVALVDELPHTATGKLSKLQLRARFHGRAGAPTPG